MAEQVAAGVRVLPALAHLKSGVCNCQSPAGLDGEPHAGFVDDLAQLLADNNIEALRADFGATTALKETIRLMAETGAAIPKWPIA